jgi:hypothetical protein
VRACVCVCVYVCVCGHHKQSEYIRTCTSAAPLTTHTVLPFDTLQVVCHGCTRVCEACDEPFCRCYPPPPPIPPPFLLSTIRTTQRQLLIWMEHTHARAYLSHACTSYKRGHTHTCANTRSLTRSCHHTISNSTQLNLALTTHARTHSPTTTAAIAQL